MPQFSDVTWIIIAGALATYATRIGGHMVLSRFQRIPPRVSAALDAVPAAVLTTLVAPAAVSNGLAEAITLIIVGFAALRLNMVAVLMIGAAAIISLRAAGLG
ncbi:MAG: AzlD family protein [Hyphomicrobiales bacterium]|nr:AzlD family protein [Hyphomicrobiales bacterium]MCP4999991.1 AzlD family protein [Hyphomicrobiales bacterium]